MNGGTDGRLALETPLAEQDNYAKDEETAEVARYLGQNSIPSLLRETHTPSELHQGAMPAIRQDISSILGLEYSAPYPLMSSRHIDKLTRDIASALPSDREVIK